MVWLLAMACAQVGVLIGDAPGVDPPTRALLEAALDEAVVEVSGAPVGPPDGPHLLISALGAATRLRIQVTKVVPGAVEGTSETVDLPRTTPGDWRARLVPVIARLFPPAPETSPKAEPPIRPEVAPPPPAPTLRLEAQAQEPSAEVWPWVGVGATGLLVAGGIVAGVLNRDLVTRGEQSSDPAEVDRLNGQVFASGLTANVLFGAAIVTAVATTIAFVAGDEP